MKVNIEQYQLKINETNAAIAAKQVDLQATNDPYVKETLLKTISDLLEILEIYETIERTLNVIRYLDSRLANYRITTCEEARAGTAISPLGVALPLR